MGFAMLAILVLKVSTDTMGAQTAVMLLIPAALCCSFVYLGIRRIKRAFTGGRYPNRRDMGAASDVIAEQFVPNEQSRAQQMAVALPERQTRPRTDPGRRTKRAALCPLRVVAGKSTTRFCTN